MKNEQKVKNSRFPVSLLVILFVSLLLLSGMHYGLLVLGDEMGWNKIVQTIVPMVYWLIVAAALTLYTGWRIKRTYEIPMQNLAQATSKVAHGDFSVYIPPLNSADKTD